MAKNNKHQKQPKQQDLENIIIFGGSLKELNVSLNRKFNITGELRMFEYSVDIDEGMEEEFSFFEQQLRETGYAGLIRAHLSVEHYYDESGFLKKYFLLQGVPIKPREE